MLAPGSGFLTVRAKLPADEAVPLTFSWVTETKVVERGIVPRKTCAPETKLLPVTVRLKLPDPTLEGFASEATGVGLNRVTELEAVVEPEVAVTVRVLGLGRVVGAVYIPVEEIVPSAFEPPEVELTDQVAVELPAPVAENCKVSPARMLAEVGETVSMPEDGAGSGVAVELEEDGPPPTQPTASTAARQSAGKVQLRARKIGIPRAAVMETILRRGMDRGYWSKGKKKGKVLPLDEVE